MCLHDSVFEVKIRRYLVVVGPRCGRELDMLQFVLEVLGIASVQVYFQKLNCPPVRPTAAADHYLE